MRAVRPYLFITTYFFWRQDRDVVLVDDPGLLFDSLRTALFLQVLAGQPEEDVLLRVFAAEEVAEDLSPRCGKTF